MGSFIDRILGEKIGTTRVVPISLKATLVFSVLLLASNFTTNYLNFILNQEDQLRLLRLVMIRDLENTLDYASTQYEISVFNDDRESAINGIIENAMVRLSGERSLVLGVGTDGSMSFLAGKGDVQPEDFDDSEALEFMNTKLETGGAVSFNYSGYKYYAVFKYSQIWDMHFIRAEENNEFQSSTRRIFFNVSILIIILTVLCMVIGIYVINYIFRFIRVLTSSIIAMQRQQKLRMIDMADASSDNVTYLGIAFNALSTTVENLVDIFKKFVARDIAMKAYQEREVRLEGKKQDLAILFTDIRRFTYITETLGMDIIKLLNLHYGKVIDVIYRWSGDVGSIIGDALLAIFGTLQDVSEHKYYLALRSAFEIQQCTSLLREEMARRREAIVRQRGHLIHGEEQLYDAVLLEVGVGVDGGEVFYGNIGSNERMTHTVIGDHVNFAARLEGLTRFYRVPVICSAAIRDVMIHDEHKDEFFFLELDSVIVKGKTSAESIYWVIENSLVDGIMQEQFDVFTRGLEKYRNGDWKEAMNLMKKCELPIIDIFLQRMSGAKKPPKDWSGVWQMESK